MEDHRSGAEEGRSSVRFPTGLLMSGSIADKALIDKIFTTYRPAVVMNLAAQAGMRYSISNPDVYIESNLIGFYNLLEAYRHSYDGGEMAWNTLCTRQVAVYMEGIRRCPLAQKIK